MPVVFQNIALIILYFVAGQGAWLLAIPPFYASVFWPSAGFALGFSYLYGYRVLPAVFIGAALLAISAPMVEVVDAKTLLGAVGLGLGSSLQALLGCYLLRKFLGMRNSLHNLRSIALLASLSVFSCFVSASVAFATFYLKGNIDFSGFLGFWEPWFPLLILLLNYGSSLAPLKRILAVCFPALILSVVIMIMFFNVQSKDLLVQQSKFNNDVKLMERELKIEFETYKHEMDAMHSFYAASSSVEHDEFAIFAEHALAQNKGINVLAWAQYISEFEREVFLEDMRSLHGGSYSIKAFDEGGMLSQGPRKRFYMPLVFAHPYETTSGVMGFDLMSHPLRLEAIETAKTTRELTATEPIRLANTAEGSDTGFILVQPVFDAPDSGELDGVLVGAFQYSKVVRSVISAWDDRGIEISLKAHQSGDMKTVYDTQGLDSDPDFIDGFFTEVPFSFANQEWLFCFYITSDFYYGHLDFTIWYILIASLLCLYFAIVFLLIITGYAAMMEQTIADKTKEISKQNKFLKLVMDNVPDMIFVKDKDFNIVQANQSFLEKFDPSQRDNLLGTSGLEQFPEDEQEIYLVNDKRAMSEGLSEVEENITDYQGITRTLITRKLRFYTDDDQPYLLGHARDVTDYLSAQRKLESILDSTAEGLITFRENGIIETFNKTCELIFGYRSEEAIGQNIATLMDGDDARDHGAQLNRYLRTGENEIIGKSREVQAKSKDGKVFPIELHVAEVRLGTRRIFSGTLRDISERKKAEELSQQIAQIFNSATIEFYIFDAENFEFLFVNEGAIKNMGYSEKELLGNKPSEFVPAYKDEKFYSMAGLLVSGEKDRIEFDMQHVRKDGSIYDVLVNIQLTQFGGRPAFIASMLDVTERNKSFLGFVNRLTLLL